MTFSNRPAAKCSKCGQLFLVAMNAEEDKEALKCCKKCGADRSNIHDYDAGLLREGKGYPSLCRATHLMKVVFTGKAIGWNDEKCSEYVFDVDLSKAFGEDIEFVGIGCVWMRDGVIQQVIFDAVRNEEDLKEIQIQGFILRLSVKDCVGWLEIFEKGTS